MGTPDPDDRVAQMYALYERGETLAAVGRRFGVSRQRVRDLFVRAGFSTRSSRETAALRRRRQLERAGEILAAYAELRDRALVARRLGVMPGVVSEVVSAELPASGRRARPARNRYADGELTAVLLEAAAEAGGPLTQHSYDGLARARTLADGRRWPTHQTHVKRFGSWRAALEAAGLRSSRAPGAQRPTFAAERCIDAIRQVERALGHVPSYDEYERAARDSDGALPSGTTVRKRFGTWLSALREAGR